MHRSPRSADDQDLGSPVRALHSLRETDAQAVSDAMVLLGPDWEMQRCESCDGHLLLLLDTEFGDRSFAMHRTAAGIGLILMDEADETVFGPFETAAGAVRQAQQILAEAARTPVAA